MSSTSSVTDPSVLQTVVTPLGSFAPATSLPRQQTDNVDVRFDQLITTQMGLAKKAKSEWQSSVDVAVNQLTDDPSSPRGIDTVRGLSKFVFFVVCPSICLCNVLLFHI